ncbi:hypothetical protein THAOC_08747 [Thalassiosira oceanica]|uniref:Uncharacterized protein n=1 Tax=Thalassiosira oceanica TaxID=159749 RepID=K0T937_THAOC|nr:hypothetical protein THAOC_08747 [Thalassiosira oceanica]|eukprot:EJK69946.1 hypothetical protein THAOC_08747 [Thalassiosira oceanica]
MQGRRRRRPRYGPVLRGERRSRGRRPQAFGGLYRDIDRGRGTGGKEDAPVAASTSPRGGQAPGWPDAVRQQVAVRGGGDELVRASIRTRRADPRPKARSARRLGQVLGVRDDVGVNGWRPSRQYSSSTNSRQPSGQKSLTTSDPACHIRYGGELRG